MAFGGPGVASLNSYLSFRAAAFQVNREGGHNARHFSALCGDNPPEITDGYARWNVIDRPLRQGVTVPQGYNPMRLKIELRFGIWDGRFNFQGWDTSPAAADEVESNIDDLNWMAGLKAIAGPSPVVAVASYHINGHGQKSQTDLVPPQCQNIGWVIDGGIQWGKSLRRTYPPSPAKRIYQDATFTLLGYTAAPGVTAPSTATTRLKGGFYRTNSSVHNALAIAGSPSSQAPEAAIYSLAREILKDPHNNPIHGTRIHLDRRSITWPIPVNLLVWVPSHSN